MKKVLFVTALVCAISAVVLTSDAATIQAGDLGQIALTGETARLDRGAVEQLVAQSKAAFAPAERNQLVAHSILFDRLDEVHVRLDQTAQGLPVFLGQVISHLDVASGKVKRVTDARQKVGDFNPIPALDAAQAVLAVRQATGLGADAVEQAVGRGLRALGLSRDESAELAIDVATRCRAEPPSGGPGSGS